MKSIIRHEIRSLVATALLCLPVPLIAQQAVAAAPGSHGQEADTRTALGRMVTLRVDNVSLQLAIDSLAARAKVFIGYRRDWIATTTHPITLDVVRQPLGVVLAQMLTGTQLHVVVIGPDAIALKLSEGGAEAPSEGGIAGVVTDAKTKRPLRGVRVVLDDSVKATVTSETGQFRFVGVPAGSHKLTVRSVGFARQMKLIVLEDDQIVTADFALEANVNTLDRVVVTATGAQRYRELGHVVAQINADSLVREAPITSLSELLTARVPGLQVTSASDAIAGGEVSLRIRGTTTTSLDPQPIVIVDGVRYKSTNFTGSTEDSRPFQAMPRSPLNDLNVNDIETIEVVKGPSASTLYGPDASNGVIVITTKHGRVGKPQWHLYVYPDLSTMNIGSSAPQRSGTVYQGWGHIPGEATVYDGQCDLRAQALSQCVLDSIVAMPSPASTPSASVIAKQRPQWHSGASVSGGAPELMYFFSGNFDSQTGALRISPDAADLLREQLGAGAVTDAVRNPNTQQTVTLHTNVSSHLSATSSLAIAANYTQATQRSIDLGVFSNQFTASTPFPGEDSASIASGRFDQTQAGAFLSTSQMQVRRLTATVSGTLQPRPWLSLGANAGTDIGQSTDRGLRMVGSLDPGDGGEAGENVRSNTNRNVHLGAMTVGHTNQLSFRTSAGLDYEYTNLDGLDTHGFGLAPGSHDITTAASQSLSRTWNEVASLGGYGEEVIGVHDRLFLTGSLRLDGSASFGDAYTPRPYPKVGVSWVVSDEPALQSLRRHGLDELRVRYSYGAASRYPNSLMKLGSVAPQNVQIEGTTLTAYYRGLLANPLLRPEHSREAEYGLDATVGSTFNVSLTWYHRRTDQELQQLSGPFAFPGEWANVGDISEHGVEATIDAKVIESDRARFDVAFSYSNTRNKVLSLGAANGLINEYGGYVVGYPLNSAFVPQVTDYADSAGGTANGIISEWREVVISSPRFMGVYTAPRTYTLSPRLSVLSNHVRLSALFDRQAGGVFFDQLSLCSHRSYNCQSLFLQSTPLLEQAKEFAGDISNAIVSSDFIRWRECSVTGDLPVALRQRLHLSTASMSLQVRNIALWTPKAIGSDPETIPQVLAVGNNNTVGLSQPRAWTLRFDIMP